MPIPVGLQHQVSNPGRTTWIFVRRVEPVLAEQHRQRLAAVTGETAAPAWLAEGQPFARALLELVGGGVLPPPPGWPWSCARPALAGAPAGVRGGWLLLDAPGGVAAAGASTGAVVAAAGVLESAGLLYYPLLALGALHLLPRGGAGAGDQEGPRGTDVAALLADPDAPASATRLLAVAARAWFRHGAHVDDLRRAVPGATAPEVVAGAEALFVTCVRFHLLERLWRQGALPPSLEPQREADRRVLEDAAPTIAQRVNALEGYPLLKDFLACAFPLWDVGAFAWRNASQAADVEVEEAFGAPAVHMEAI